MSKGTISGRAPPNLKDPIMKIVESGPSSMWTGPCAIVKLRTCWVSALCFPLARYLEPNTIIHSVPVPWTLSLGKISSMEMISVLKETPTECSRMPSTPPLYLPADFHWSCCLPPRNQPLTWTLIPTPTTEQPSAHRAWRGPTWSTRAHFSVKYTSC